MFDSITDAQAAALSIPELIARLDLGTDRDRKIAEVLTTAGANSNDWQAGYDAGHDDGYAAGIDEAEDNPD